MSRRIRSRNAGRTESTSNPLSPAPFARRLRVEPLEDRRMLSVTLFVDADAPVGGDGLGWGSAYGDLQAALADAKTRNGDAVSENDVDSIWIAEGVYRPTAELEPGDPRSASFSLVDKVTVYGGFSGTETTLEERDFSAHVTTLSGDLGTLEDSSDNAYTVVYCGADIEAAVDGVLITGGNADGSDISGHLERRRGGGISNSGMLTVTNTTLSRNSAKGDGGGIYSYETLTVANSTLSENSAGDDGGGIYSSGTLTVTGSTLSGNSAMGHSEGSGGGICSFGTLTVTDSTFSGNLATGSPCSGGGIASSGTLTLTNSTLLGNAATPVSRESTGVGGGIAGSGTLTVTNSTFSGNAADDDGGGIYNSGTLTVTNSTLSRNSADYHNGGGIYSSGTLTITNSLLAGNSAGLSGGGISSPGTLTITNSTLAGNSADHYYGGGIHNSGTLTVTNSMLAGNSADRYGGGIYNSGELMVTNSTLSGNAADYGGGIYSDEALTVNNSILWRNDGGDLEGFGGLSGSQNLIGIDPKFVRDPSDGGDGWGDDPATPGIDESSNDDYGDLHLTAHSPAIDHGDDALAVDAGGNPLTTDRDGNPRAYNGSPVDAGAFEFQGAMAVGREAASLTVTTSQDVFDLYDNAVSLREAIYYAGSGSLGVTITFDGALDEEKIMLSGTSLWLDKGLTIDASLLTSLTVDADGNSRVLTVVAPEEDAVELRALTITGGSTDYGGGIYSGGTLTITNSTLSGNSAGSGGGIYNSGTLTVTNSTLFENSASSGGGISNYGTLTVTNSTLSGNSATGNNANAGGIYNYHGTVTVTNSTLSGNSATGDNADAGGIYNYHGTATVTSSMLSGNSAIGKYYGYGGAIRNNFGTLTVTNSTLSGNSANGTYNGYGGGISSSGTLTVTNSTLSGNSARSGGGIYNSGTATLNNTVVAANAALSTPDVYLYRYSGTISGSNSLVGDGSGQSSLVHGENGNLVGTSEAPIDPRFIRNPSDGGDGWGDDPSTPDVDESANDDFGNVRLRPDSPAVDTGDDSLLPADEFDLDGDGDTAEPIPFDLVGNPRVAGARVDMGGYEYDPTPPIPGDLDGNGRVNSADLDIVRAHWGESVTPGNLFDGDPSGDGVVNSDDLDIIRANWGQTAVAAAVPTAESGAEPSVEDSVYGPVLPNEAATAEERNRDTFFAAQRELAEAVWVETVERLKIRREVREARAVDVVLLEWDGR